MRRSGLQKDVLSLYRRILREAHRKDAAMSKNGDVNASFLSLLQEEEEVGERSSTTTTTSYARKQFRSEATAVKRSDFKTIEYKIRRGDKQLKLLKMPGVTLVGGAS
mmetsp:Transcript_25894/g.44050  ORF Transcript_25894/g.44050 Transcript_25894/m.44050 type:complete len:107 (+) Transcript_25894:1433-1753(+)